MMSYLPASRSAETDTHVIDRLTKLFNEETYRRNIAKAKKTRVGVVQMVEFIRAEPLGPGFTNCTLVIPLSAADTTRFDQIHEIEHILENAANKRKYDLSISFEVSDSVWLYAMTIDTFVCVVQVHSGGVMLPEEALALCAEFSGSIASDFASIHSDKTLVVCLPFAAATDSFKGELMCAILSENKRIKSLKRLRIPLAPTRTAPQSPSTDTLDTLDHATKCLVPATAFEPESDTGTETVLEWRKTHSDVRSVKPYVPVTDVFAVVKGGLRDGRILNEFKRALDRRTYDFRAKEIVKVRRKKWLGFAIHAQNSVSILESILAEDRRFGRLRFRAIDQATFHRLRDTYGR